MNVNEHILLTFDESWIRDPDIHRFRVTADLGECEEEMENEQGVMEMIKFINKGETDRLTLPYFSLLYWR